MKFWISGTVPEKTLNSKNSFDATRASRRGSLAMSARTSGEHAISRAGRSCMSRQPVRAACPPRRPRRALNLDFSCAVKRRWSTVGKVPPGLVRSTRSNRTVVEATKLLKPLV